MADLHSTVTVTQIQTGFQFDFGTDPKKLHRTDAPDTSVKAAYSIDTAGLEQKVLAAIKKFPRGCTQDEVLDLFPGYPYSSITARFRALLDKNLIKDTGERRPGYSGRSQRVLIGV